MQAPAVRVLRDSAAVLRLRSVTDRAARSADLRDALTELRSVSQGRYREDIAELLDESSDAAAVAHRSYAANAVRLEYARKDELSIQ